MQRFKKYAIGAGGMLVLVVAIVLATGSGSAVAAQITNVFVTNDASHPVPVAQQGTANVNVTNSTVPVHEQGIATVQPAGTPVWFDLRQGSSGYTVPAGKRLVVQYINGVHDPSNSGVTNFWLQTIGNNPIILTLDGHFTDGEDYVDEQIGPVSFDPGATVYLQTPGDNEDPAHLYVFGYLTNA
jgi:hypothetical protein